MIVMNWFVSRWKKDFLDIIWCNHASTWILAGWSDFNGVSPLLPYLTGRSVWCRLASISVRAGAGREKCIGWPRCGSAWPDPASRRAGQLTAVTGCHSSVHIAIVMRQMGVCKNPSNTKHISLNSEEYNIKLLFQLIYRENMVTVTLS